MASSYVYSSEINDFAAALAIRLYEKGEGKLPEKLEDLLPKYIATLPEDPFNGFKPLKYIKQNNGYVVYSIGPDMQDQRGEAILNLTEKGAIDYSKLDGDIVLTYQANSK